MRIKHFRKQLRLSQEKLAKLVGVAQASISQWESNEVVPALKNIRKMASIFGCSVDELIGDADHD